MLRGIRVVPFKIQSDCLLSRWNSPHSFPISLRINCKSLLGPTYTWVAWPCYFSSWSFFPPSFWPCYSDASWFSTRTSITPTKLVAAIELPHVLSFVPLNATWLAPWFLLHWMSESLPQFPLLWATFSVPLCKVVPPTHGSSALKSAFFFLPQT